MRVSIRRTLRVGAQSGTPVEDLGVEPDAVHRLTRDDVLSGNVDLLEAAGELLAGMTVRRLDASLSLSGGTLTVELEVAELDRVDVYVDDRPQSSHSVTGTQETVTVDDVTSGQRLRLEGFAGEELVAARRMVV
jgi:hypothetical protein